MISLSTIYLILSLPIILSLDHYTSVKLERSILWPQRCCIFCPFILECTFSGYPHDLLPYLFKVFTQISPYLWSLSCLPYQNEQPLHPSPIPVIFISTALIIWKSTSLVNIFQIPFYFDFCKGIYFGNSFWTAVSPESTLVSGIWWVFS